MLATASPLAAQPGSGQTDPVAWPTGPGTDPDLSATAHTARFSGPDRYQTNLATALGLRGMGSYPFDSPDRTLGGTTSLAEADQWWGARTCPYAVLVVAGDTFADALAAASLSDPTNRSSEPRLQRVAAADPLFDPVGGFDRVDTDGAPIIVTRSARSGARSLSPSAVLSLRDLASGGCTTAREAVIVGGDAAVAPEVAAELVSLGYDEVFRVAGTDRYATAARVAQALGTGPGAAPDAPCLDSDVTDGTARQGFYGNAVVEFRFTPDTCRLLGRSVVLADGDLGADALAAGWWTSFWQVPILLTAPDGSLPQATRTALQTLDVDHVIVLGGTGRIPEATADEAGAIAGAAVGRIAGRDRYATSVEMAKVFGGWWPTEDGRRGRASVVCVAASGPGSLGWPDALAAGPWCGRASGAAAAVRPPMRALPPVSGPGTLSLPDVRPGHDAVPILLVPVGVAFVPTPVDALLRDVFPPEAGFCGGASTGSCVPPGFGVVFGGRAAVSEEAETRVAARLAGAQHSTEHLNPVASAVFPTRLDLGAVYLDGGAGEAGRACAAGGALGEVRWLAAWEGERRRSFLGARDLAPDGYVGGRSAPACLAAAGGAARWLLEVVGISGRRVSVATLDLRAERWLQLTRMVEQPASTVAPGGSGSWQSEGPPADPVDVLVEGQAHPITSARLTLDLHQRSSAWTFSGSAELQTAAGPVTALLDGDVRSSGDRYLLRGRSGSIHAGRTFVGGFSADLVPGPDGSWTVTWRLDGLPAS